MTDSAPIKTDRMAKARAAQKTQGGGRPAIMPGSFADPGPRGRFLVEKYGMDEILKWYDDIKGGNAKRVPLSTGDILLLGRIARAATSEFSLELLHNRTFGKVPERNINLNINADVDPAKLTEDARAMLQRLRD